MTCEQTSGIFLNLSCHNQQSEVCSNCKKKVCDTHSHSWESSLFCEDCYWEHFLLAAETKEHVRRDRYEDDVIIAGSSYDSSSSDSKDDSGGFDGGFGGAEFSGGGAGAAWTDGDIQSLEDSGEVGGGLLSDGDDTFFYS